MNKAKLFYHLGNALIITSLVVLLYIYLPFVSLYLFPPRLENSFESGFYIQIPKIHAQARVVENVDPWNKQEYMEALDKGVAEAKGSVLPGETGTIFLFAHSSVEPWRMTWQNSAFLRLGGLQKNDEVFLFKYGKKHTYRVFELKEVWPNEVEYLKNNSKDVLILQTCTPIGTTFKRLLVFAKEVRN